MELIGVENTIQQYIVKVTELPGKYVRPAYTNGSAPDGNTDWIAFNIKDFNFVGNNNASESCTQQAFITVRISVYGESSFALASKLLQSFNLYGYRSILKDSEPSLKIYKQDKTITRAPSLGNTEWRDCFEFEVAFTALKTLRKDVEALQPDDIDLQIKGD